MLLQATSRPLDMQVDDSSILSGNLVVIPLLAQAVGFATQTQFVQYRGVH